MMKRLLRLLDVSRDHREAIIRVALFLALLPALATATEPLPEVTHDGLHRIRDAKVAVAWAKPDADLSIYNSVILLPAHVAFLKNWQREHRDITKKDMERIMRRVADLFRQAFVEVLEEGGYPVVHESGDDVLLIRPAIIDLDVTAPDVMKPGRTRTFAANAGAATIYIELFDSTSGEILARAADRRRARDTSFSWQMSGTSVHDSAEARRVFKAWATLLKERLDEFHGTRTDSMTAKTPEVATRSPRLETQ